jgi:hypothetical protein
MRRNLIILDVQGDGGVYSLIFLPPSQAWIILGKKNRDVRNFTVQLCGVAGTILDQFVRE